MQSRCFLECGHAYVYLAFGNSLMLNVSSEASGVAAGILIRAIEPTDGIAVTQNNCGLTDCENWRAAQRRSCAALAIGAWMESTFVRPARYGSSRTIMYRTNRAEQPTYKVLPDHDPCAAIAEQTRLSA